MLDFKDGSLGMSAYIYLPVYKLESEKEKKQTLWKKKQQ